MEKNICLVYLLIKYKIFKFRVRILYIIILFGLFGCSYDPRDDLSEELKLAYDFSVALLAHDKIVYELAALETHEQLDDWFESTRATQCYDPQVLSGGTKQNGSMLSISPLVILCQGSNPICGRIEFEKLYLYQDNTDGKKQLKVTHWWDDVQLCEAQEYYENIMISPLPYVHLKKYD